MTVTITPPFTSAVRSQEANQSPGTRVILALHGGAGTIERHRMTPETEKAYRDALSVALQLGYDILIDGGTSIQVVEAVAAWMEDSPLFNAGRGSVLNETGKVEMDASIMDGRTLKAGAVAAVSNIKNPIKVARAVMERTEHVLLSGEGALGFARKHGFEIVDDDYFLTPRRIEELRRQRERSPAEKGEESYEPSSEPLPYGTVGVVALDKEGNLAAATSTGGRTNKMVGRIGDSPIVGAGNYANNKTCAISATGHGEYFMRGLTAYDVSALMEYKGQSLARAADEVIVKLTALGGTGGVVAIDSEGNVAMPFNTPGMYRGYVDETGRKVVKIFRDE